MPDDQDGRGVKRLVKLLRHVVELGVRLVQPLVAAVEEPVGGAVEGAFGVVRGVPDDRSVIGTAPSRVGGCRTCARVRPWARGCRTSRSCRAPCRRNAACVGRGGIGDGRERRGSCAGDRGCAKVRELRAKDRKIPRLFSSRGSTRGGARASGTGFDRDPPRCRRAGGSTARWIAGPARSRTAG